MKSDGNPILFQERACKDTTYSNNEKYVSRSYLPKLVAISNSEEESVTRGGGGDNKAMDCSRRGVLACIACNDCSGLLYRARLCSGPQLGHDACTCTCVCILVNGENAIRTCEVYITTKFVVNE